MKEFLAEHTTKAMGIIIAAITAIGVFVGPWLASRRQRKVVEQDKRLRAHFKELRGEAWLVVSSASNLTRMARDSTIVVAIGSQAVTISGIEEVKISGSFEVHFPEQAKQLSTLKQKIREYNAKCEDFRQIKIAETAGNMENQTVVAKILGQADELTGGGKEFANQLATELNDMDNFWPGKKTNRFKKLKKTCPKCKELF